MVNEYDSAGRFRRLTRAALAADSAMRNAEGVAISASNLLDDLSIIVDRLDGAETGLEDLIADCRREVAGYGQVRRDAHVVLGNVGSIVESVQRILELVEWALTPAFVAREQLGRTLDRIADFRAMCLRRVAGTPPPRQRPQAVPELAQVRLLAG